MGEVLFSFPPPLPLGSVAPGLDPTNQSNPNQQTNKQPITRGKEQTNKMGKVLSLKEMKALTVRCDVYKTLGLTRLEGALNVDYHLIVDNTLEQQIQVLRAQERGDSEVVLDELIDTTLKLIDWWDMLDKPAEEGGQPIPLTREALKNEVPAPMLMDIINATALHRLPPGEANGRRR